jgi:hypothetical protein
VRDSSIGFWALSAADLGGWETWPEWGGSRHGRAGFVAIVAMSQTPRSRNIEPGRPWCRVPTSPKSSPAPYQGHVDELARQLHLALLLDGQLILCEL